MDPQQYLNALIGIGQGDRYTAFEDPNEVDPNRILQVTGPYQNRRSANRGRLDLSGARAASGTYDPIPVQQTQGGASGLGGALSAISSLRPRGQGFVGEGPDYGPPGSSPIGRVYPGSGTNEYLPMLGAAPSVPQDRTDVGDGGGGFDIGGYLTGPGMGQAMTAAGGAMMEAAGKSGATFGGSLGTGLKGFADERARFQTSEAARRKAAQVGQTTPQELRDRQNTVRAMLAQNQIPQDQWPQYLARVVTQKGYEGVLDELGGPGAAGGDLATSLEETAALVSLSAEVAALEAVPEGQRTPEQVAELAAKQRELQYMERATDTADPVPPTPPSPSTVQKDLDFIAQAQGYIDAQAAQADWKTNDRGDWVRIHMAQIRGQSQPTQYRGRTPSRGQIAAESRRIDQYDEWFGGREAQFEKNLDTFNEVLFELDQRIADRQIEGGGDWANDDGSGFYQAMKGALVSRMPFMGSALRPEDTNTLDLVRAVVFQSLKETLGGQFAEREATALVQAAYNPMLPPKVNRRRIQRLMRELRSTDHYMTSMADYYHRTGELAFYTHQNAEEAWDLAVQTGEVVGLGS
jgi:hypothetical protein